MILLQDDSLSIPGHTDVDSTNIANHLLYSSISMALLLRRIVTDQIFILIHFSSDEMLCYLQNHALTLIHSISCIMFQCGHYYLVTHQDSLPNFDLSMLTYPFTLNIKMIIMVVLDRGGCFPK